MARIEPHKPLRRAIRTMGFESNTAGDTQPNLSSTGRTARHFESGSNSFRPLAHLSYKRKSNRQTRVPCKQNEPPAKAGVKGFLNERSNRTFRTLSAARRRSCESGSAQHQPPSARWPWMRCRPPIPGPLERRWPWRRWHIGGRTTALQSGGSARRTSSAPDSAVRNGIGAG